MTSRTDLGGVGLGASSSGARSAGGGDPVFGAPASTGGAERSSGAATAGGGEPSAGRVLTGDRERSLPGSATGAGSASTVGLGGRWGAVDREDRPDEPEDSLTAPGSEARFSVGSSGLSMEVLGTVDDQSRLLSIARGEDGRGGWVCTSAREEP